MGEVNNKWFVCELHFVVHQHTPASHAINLSTQSTTKHAIFKGAVVFVNVYDVEKPGSGFN